MEKGNGKKLGLYKKLGEAFADAEGAGTSVEVAEMFETGKIEHLLAAIDNIVNGEVNLPPGEQTKLFERIREVGKGYTVIGTNYTYNARNQLIHRENAIRYEEYDYTYDDAGNLLTDSRSKYEWNALGQLTKVTFSDGFGEKYAYDMLGRRISKTQFNHTGSTQEVTQYTYKGDTWAITEESDGSGNVTKSYTFDANDRPLSITMEGQTFWYVYNGHGDVVALTDKDGKVAARYEYDAWGLVTRMYNGLGERVREGIGWIGDLGTGNGSPGSVQGPEDESGNTDPDYHPGIGNAAEGTESTDGTEAVEAESTVDGELSALLAEVDIEPTADITTELVKENPYRYAGYYWDRKTQYYYLQARYYDPRLARFISEDTYEGEIDTPLSLNQYVYVTNNPLNYIDPSGHQQIDIGVVYTQEDKNSIAYYQAIFGLAKSLGYKDQMQAAHAQANLIRLKYQSRIDRTIYADSLFKPGTIVRSLTLDMYNELLYGNVREIRLVDDPLFIGMGFITGARQLRSGYVITKEAIDAVMKQWGKTNGQKAVQAFSKSVAKGFVSKEGTNGVKDISSAGLQKKGIKYTVEIKVKNKEFSDYRIYGYQKKDGTYVFDWFSKALH
ncbi:RHS repeat domain-containing protein [Paenibacillus harenae]|uniref:RHS repeat domain-containing protein n=1 Tax=Paenibacillus harenae TaxID=306543 RepID=UPI0027928ABC|nr:RHS repeat-associated core domain-containing protein [Paenibacillus harenae]MDQ0062454.1 RHS repeat-associated protein [Paenibacillus harenae]